MISSLEDDELYVTVDVDVQSCSYEAGTVGLEDSTGMPESLNVTGERLGLVSLLVKELEYALWQIVRNSRSWKTCWLFDG